MYIFSRRVQMSGTHARKSTKWAVGQLERVNSLSDLTFTLWADVYGPRVGSVLFSTIVADLATLVAGSDRLLGNDDYLTSIEEGSEYMVGTPEDTLIQIVHGTPDPNREVAYVSTVSAVVADGAYGRAAAVGTEICERATKITGIPTVFGFDTTGLYGGVRWLTPFANIAEVDSSGAQLASDASWTEYLDHDAKGVFAEAPELTQQALLRRLA
ncbi:MAG: hypothetical protein NVS1B12_11370 [Acidimicrobiales bacterium]